MSSIYLIKEEPIRLFHIEPKFMSFYTTPLSQDYPGDEISAAEAVPEKSHSGTVHAGCNKLFLEERSGGGPHCLQLCSMISCYLR